MKTYNVALIGCGHMGEVHLKHICFKENIKITCVCDINEDAAKAFSRKFNIPFYETCAENLVKRDDVDIVIICTYPSTHLDILKLCIKYKKHVICEKPITDTLEKGEEFVSLVKENSDVKVLIGHILRHNETYKKVASMIKDGLIGSPIVMRMSQNHHTLNWDRYLKLINETSPVIDCGVHYIDVMQWFTQSKVKEVKGIGMRTDEDVPKGKFNYEMMTVKLEDGSVGYYEAGWTKTINSDNTKEFIGPKGSIKIIYKKDRFSHTEAGDLIEYFSLSDNTYKNIDIIADRKPADIELDYLIDMIENGKEAFPTIDDVFSSFKVVLEAEEYIKNNS